MKEIKSFKNISIKYMLQNKKRTLLTFMGIILSVALITCIGLFLKSMEKTQIESSIKDHGEWHINFKGVNPEIIDKIKGNSKISKIGLVDEKILDGDFKEGLNIKLQTIDGDAKELSRYVLSDGSFPENEDEIALSKDALQVFNIIPKIGDIINFKEGDGNLKKLKLTGILENNKYIYNRLEENLKLGVSYSTNLDFKNGNVYVKVNDKENLKESVKDILNTFKELDPETNESLLRLLGASSNKDVNNMMFVIIFITVSIIVISTVVVIYNSFFMGIAQKMKHIGLLKAIGATKKQIRGMILREATIYCLIGIPLGLILGTVAFIIVIMCFKIFFKDGMFEDFYMTFNIVVYILSAVVSICSIYVSAIIPSKFASKVSPLVSISGQSLISNIKVKERKHTLAKKIFKFEGLMAAKNLKRNKKRYLSSIISMAISVVLFVTFSYLMSTALKTFSNKDSESSTIHFNINDNSKEKNLGINSELISKIQSFKEVKTIYKGHMGFVTNAIVDDENLNKYAKENLNTEMIGDIKINQENKKSLSSIIIPYDDEKLNASTKYISHGEIDKNKLDNENGVILVKDAETFTKDNKIIKGQILKYNVGDEFYLDMKPTIKEGSIVSDENLDKNNLVKVKVVGIVDSMPFDDQRGSNSIIVSEKFGEALSKKNEKFEDGSKAYMLSIVLKDVAYEKEVSSKLNSLSNEYPIRIFNIIQMNRNEHSGILQMQVLVYGFLSVIVLIACVNVFNTLRTNINFRKKEIASLRATGMSMKQISKMIRLEGIFYGIKSSILGTIISILLILILHKYMSNALRFQFEFPFKYILISFIGTITIGFLATISPLKEIKKTDILEDLREE